MGLLISILVVCVGVVELFEFYKHVTARLPNQSGLLDNKTPSIRLERGFLSHEDIEIECSPSLLHHPSPETQKYLVTEKRSKSRSPSPRRRFVISETKPEQEELPQFLVTDITTARGKNKSPSPQPRYVLVDQQNSSKAPIPLPEKFLISNEAPTEPVKQCLGINLHSLNLQCNSLASQATLKEFVSSQDFNASLLESKKVTDALLREESRSRSISPLPPTINIVNQKPLVDLPVLEQVHLEQPSTSKIPDAKTDENDNYHRSGSPYPNLNVEIRRGSICPEFLEEEVTEADEDISESHSSTEFWSNKQMLDHNLRSTSKEKLNVPAQRQKSKSCDNLTVDLGGGIKKIISSSDLPHENDYVLLDEKLASSKELLNSLDGLSEKSRNKDSKRSFKRKKNKQQGLINHVSNKNESQNEHKNLDKNQRLIFSGEYTKAMNKDWHGQHFCCWQCDESLTGQRYVLRDDHPYCVSCYESVFANACEKCNRIIGIDSKDLSYKDKHWHEACFLCTTCGESLVDKQFGSKGDRIYCGRCYDNQFASRCDGCNEIFRAGKFSNRFVEIVLLFSPISWHY